MANRFFTIGYGGRSPGEFVKLLQEHNVALLADVRLRPDKASMGSYAKAKIADKGIEKLVAQSGIPYLSLIELGNIFLSYSDWTDRYARLLKAAGNLLLEPLLKLPPAFCLMCSEKRVHDCHRLQIAKHLARRGYEVVHIE
jgi:uncharacterized protein (DUF488 family)